MEILGQSDLLFCNENEAKAIAKCEDSDEAINIISKICPNVVMTKGKNGAKVFFNNKSYDFEACPTEVIDTTGAGDMFAGAFLFGLLNYDKFVKNTDASNLEDKINFSGKLASKASSIIVSQLGARYTGEFDKIIQNIL
ncbi:5-dehydro-2-deoxygluconokinase [bioreactor metagenome]|uniref:5-dehydro-2-deoxygluconokinase n=1 Tax=bioreactor metagenome TaxID=1076179 RepID=A0A645IHV9_9ZZZZ